MLMLTLVRQLWLPNVLHDEHRPSDVSVFPCDAPQSVASLSACLACLLPCTFHLVPLTAHHVSHVVLTKAQKCNH